MSAAPPGVSLRPVRAEDAELLFRVYAATREEELAPVPWSAGQKEAFLRMQFEAQDRYYRDRYPGADRRVVELDGEPVGRLYLARDEAEHRVVDVALLPPYRGRGVGTYLLLEVVGEADRAGKPVSIHVELHNPARRLYERLGFLPAEERGAYLLMQRPAPRMRREEAGPTTT